MVECYGKGIKLSLLLANSIIFLSGAVVLTLGIWTVSDRSFMERLLGINLYIASSVLLIVTGSVVAFIALLGSLGAYKEVKCMLKTYFIILMALLTVILSTGAICFVFRLELGNRLKREMQYSMRLYGTEPHITEAWDSMQTNFECCGITMDGVRGYESWRRESPKFNVTDGPVVPATCCRSHEDDPIKRACQGRQPRKEDTYFEGCYDRMKAVVGTHTMAILLVGCSGVAIIAFGLILSGILFLIIRNRSTLEAKTLSEVLSAD